MGEQLSPAFAGPSKAAPCAGNSLEMMRKRFLVQACPAP